jgi:hypothetical protein
MRFTKNLLLKITLLLIITSQVARVYAQDAAHPTINWQY